MTESKPAPEFVMHQVPVFDTHKDYRVPGITRAKHSERLSQRIVCRWYLAETYESPHRHA